MQRPLLKFIACAGILFFVSSIFSFAQDMQAENVQTRDSAVVQPAEKAVTLPSFSYKTTKESLAGRAFILSIGVFPFSYFYTGFVFDVVRFVSNNFDFAYAPWPFKTQNSVALTNSEMWLKLGISAGISVSFGILSAILK